MSKQFTITIDRLYDPEQIKSYTITRTINNQIRAKGRYFYFFGYRIGLHLHYDKQTLRFVSQ